MLRYGRSESAINCRDTVTTFLLDKSAGAHCCCEILLRIDNPGNDDGCRESRIFMWASDCIERGFNADDLREDRDAEVQY